MRVFLSHSSKDHELASCLKTQFEEILNAEVFFADTTIKTGELSFQKIDEALERADIFAFVWSRNYASSEACKREINYWLEQNQPSEHWFGIGADDTPLRPTANQQIKRLGALPIAEASRYIAQQIRQKYSDSKVGRHFELSRNTRPLAPEFGTNNAFVFDLDRFIDICKAKEQLTKKLLTDDRTIDQGRFNSVRIPKFMLFKTGRDHLLAILDANSSVDVTRLKKTSERAAPQSRIASNINDLGFPGFVHPAFRYKNLKIYIDAIIFTQFLLYPTSLVQLPIDENDRKQNFYISSFVRALLEFHKETEIVYANISKGKWLKDPLYRAILHTPTFTRFAPTPNNSIHIGSLRNALISYLISKQNADGAFHIRFDDTNLRTGATDKKATILRDLDWIGLPVPLAKIKQDGDLFEDGGDNRVKWFSQSSKKQTENYSAALQTLLTSQFAVESDDGIRINFRQLELECFCWVDLFEGPKIYHNFPTKSGKEQELKEDDEVGYTYELVWKESGLPRYKFAGVVDDLLYTTLVVRDHTQQRFTLVQAALRQTLYNALSAKTGEIGAKSRDDARSLFNTQSRLFNGDKSRPLPFLSPRIYYHSDLVLNKKLEKLSKSADGANSIYDFRVKGTYLREAVAAFLARSLVPDSFLSLSVYSRANLAQRAAIYGCGTFWEDFSRQFEVSWLKQSRSVFQNNEGNLGIRKGNALVVSGSILRGYDRLVLRRMPLFRFKHSLLEVLESAEQIRLTAEQIERLFASRSWFSGWQEITTFATRVNFRLPLFSKWHLTDEWKSYMTHVLERVSEINLDNVHERILRGDKTFAKFNSICRERLLGNKNGPPVEILLWIIGRNALLVGR